MLLHKQTYLENHHHPKRCFTKKITKVKYFKYIAHFLSVLRSLFLSNSAGFNLSSNIVHENLLKMLVVICL